MVLWQLVINTEKTIPSSLRRQKPVPIEKGITTKNVKANIT